MQVWPVDEIDSNHAMKKRANADPETPRLLCESHPRGCDGLQQRRCGRGTSSDGSTDEGKSEEADEDDHRHFAVPISEDDEESFKQKLKSHSRIMSRGVLQEIISPPPLFERRFSTRTRKTVLSEMDEEEEHEQLLEEEGVKDSEEDEEEEHRFISRSRSKVTRNNNHLKDDLEIIEETAKWQELPYVNEASRDKKAKVKLKEEEDVAEAKRKRDEKKEDRKKKKLKPFEEENLSKRLYESRNTPPTLHDLRPPPIDMLTPAPTPTPNGALRSVVGFTPMPEEDDKRVAIRIKLCGDCGARHVAGPCPFTRPIHLLSDSCAPLSPQNGVIVTPTRLDAPVNLSSAGVREDEPQEETWRDPQRAGSPNCYGRTSLPQGLTLERRLIPLPTEGGTDDDTDGIAPQPPSKCVEVVVARTPVMRYSQMGPVVGVPVRERDIPDDFCMVNLWEVFGNDGKHYISTVDPNKSNWTRYLRPAPNRDSANLVVIPRPLHDPDCGGCNMKFPHPLYYRMHCSVFHDPNYSLTIRKYHCKVCGLAVLGKENIMRHAAEQHEGRGAYQCQFCKKFFLRLHSLDMHVTYSCSKNPARVFPLCDYCGKKFCQPQHLRSHQKRMHAGRCVESGCNAAFTTKQCLQFHYKKVHGYASESMPKIERCIPYTFDSYSGGLVTDPGRGKVPPNSVSNQMTPDTPSPATSTIVQDLDTQVEDPPLTPAKSPSRSPQSPEVTTAAKLPPATTLHGYVAKYAAAATTRLVSKGSRKWLGDSLGNYERDHLTVSQRDIYDFEERLENDILQKKKIELENDEEKLFRRESTASLLVEAALNVAEHTLKSDSRSHDRLLGYSPRYSPSPTTVDQLLPHDAALTTHIKYTTASDDERGQLEYTLEREYDPRDLPEVMVVQDNLSSRELHDSLNHDLHDNLSGTLEHLPPAAVSEADLRQAEQTQNEHAHNLSLAKTEDLVPPSSVASIGSSTPLPTTNSNGGLEPTLHILDQLPVSQGMPVTIPASLAVGLDMTYKHYRIVPETAVGLSHEHILTASLEDTDSSVGLDAITVTNSGTDQLPLPELQSQDFRSLSVMRSPEPSRSPYLSPSQTPEMLRSYLVQADGSRSPIMIEHGIDVSRPSLFIRPSDIISTHRYQGEQQTIRAQVYEIDRPPSHSIDLTLGARNLTYTTESSRITPVSTAMYISDERIDERHSLDLTLPRHDQDSQRSSSPFFHSSVSRPASPLPLYIQVSPGQLSPLPPVTLVERSESNSPDRMLSRHQLPPLSPTVSSISIPNGLPLPPISRIVALPSHSPFPSAHSPFHLSRPLSPNSRQSMSPTYSDSFLSSVTNGTQTLATSSLSSTNKDRPISPYSQYNSPYNNRHQDTVSPPPGYHYQYY